VHETPADPDISESMGVEDYTLDRPNRADSAPDPSAYARGWSQAALAEAEQRCVAQENDDR
jgi:hypothetical protein